MGCKSTKTKQNTPLNINIVDQTFMKLQNNEIKRKMKENNINYKQFSQKNDFIESIKNRYCNQIALNHKSYQQVIQNILKLDLYPNIYVFEGKKQNNENYPQNIIFVQNYNTLIAILQKKRKQRIQYEQIIRKNKKYKFTAVKILCKKGLNSLPTNINIFDILNQQNISFQIYDTYSQLQLSRLKSQSIFVIVDYFYQDQVLNLYQNSQTKIICYCQLKKFEIYSPSLYYFSNNFKEIIEDVIEQMNELAYKHVKCTTVYLHTSIQNVDQYGDLLEKFGFEVRYFKDFQKMLVQTMYYFSVTIIVAEEQVQNIQLLIVLNLCKERIKLITIEKHILPNLQSMRKIIKQCKKGYKAEKRITRSIDIIDKYQDSQNFRQIKSELKKLNINCFCYKNFDQYNKYKKFISPFIISNLEDRLLIYNYLQQISSKTQIIIFCNKNKVQDIHDVHKYAFASSQFSKILGFIKDNLVYEPLIRDQLDDNQDIQQGISNIKNMPKVKNQWNNEKKHKFVKINSFLENIQQNVEESIIYSQYQTELQEKCSQNRKSIPIFQINQKWKSQYLLLDDKQYTYKNHYLSL